LRELGLAMIQVRPAAMLASRAPSDSRDSTLRRRVNALPRSLPGPIGTRTMSSSSTRFVVPSTAMSSRAQNRCWWNGADNPALTWDAYG
jgi:hypothetical protein